jgi:hypothetical protein
LCRHLPFSLLRVRGFNVGRDYRRWPFGRIHVRWLPTEAPVRARTEGRGHGASTEMAVSQMAEAGRSRLWPRKGRVSPIGEEDATGMRQGGSFSPRR